MTDGDVSFFFLCCLLCRCPESCTLLLRNSTLTAHVHWEPQIRNPQTQKQVISLSAPHFFCSININPYLLVVWQAFPSFLCAR